jgi:dienelactone hydrolase
MKAKTEFKSGGVTITAEQFQPAGTPNGGAVLLLYGSDGMVDNVNGPWATMLREYGTELAAKGFVAIIPDYFLRTKTAAGSIDYKRDGGVIVAMNRDAWATTVMDAATHAKGLPGVDSKRLGIIGFSLGGHLCLRARSAAKTIVEFFAPVLDGIGKDKVAGMPVQIHHGAADELVPFAQNAVPIEKALRAAGARVDLQSYPGAGHGFAAKDAANKTAGSDSKSSAISFLVANL